MDDQIYIWHDRWLDQPHLFRPFSAAPKNCNVEWVSSLIIQDTASWDIDLINSLFPPCEAALILLTPLSIHLPTDRLMWHYDSKGLFWVKSAYKVAILFRDDASSSSQSSLTTSTWSKLWKASAPGKVKIYAWKVCRNILPIRSSLEKKGLAVDNICVFFSFSLELALHVFNVCPFTQAVFSSSHLDLGQRPLADASFWD